jgi:hypothetical protein
MPPAWGQVSISAPGEYHQCRLKPMVWSEIPI